MIQTYHTMDHAIELFKKLHGSTIQHVIDVGANIGTPFLKDAFTNAHHYLIEPLPHLHTKLIDNYKDIKYTLFSEPLLDTIKPMYLYEYNVTTQSGFCNSSILMDEKDILNKDSMTLSRILTSSTLDNLFSNYNFNKLDTIIKIDVDGNEAQILNGGKNTLSNVALLIIECNAQSINTIMSLAHNMGFELFDIVSPGYYRDLWIQSDLIFINQIVKNDNVKFRPFDEGAWTGSDWNTLP